MKPAAGKRDGKFKPGTDKAKKAGSSGGAKSSRKGVKNGQSKRTQK